MTSLAIVACSLVTDLEGLSSGSSSGAQPPEAGATPDAAVDGPFDGPSDAGNETGADAGPFCASKSGYALCADFDDGVLPTPFSRSEISGPGSALTYDSTDSRSPPRSALMVAGAPGTETQSALVWDAPTAPSELVIDLDVRMESFGSGSFDLLGLGRSAHNLEIEVNDDGTLAFDLESPAFDGGDQTNAIGGLLADKAWHHLQISMTKTATAIDTKATLDGVAIGSAKMQLELLAGPFVFYIGDTVVQVTPKPWRARFDNVLVVIR
ncbi:MAG: hypothetical protein JST00_13180 [Deltaproteobacteria bacterium]|nr:hypothetical protein [Deltaproteobacteria bacterium]